MLEQQNGTRLGQKPRVNWYIYVFLFISIFLQKVGAPGSGGAISAGTVFYLLILIFFIITRKLFIDERGLVAYSLFVGGGAVSLILNSMFIENSLASFLIVMAIQAGFMVWWNPNNQNVPTAKIYSNTMFVFSLLGIAQFFLQYIIGQEHAFMFDYILGENYSVAGFNNLIKITSGSPALKSNGVFFAEPSLFSQFIAIAIAIEFSKDCRPSRIIVMTVALFTSFSGTGLMILGAYAIYLAITSGRVGLVVMLFAAAIIIITIGQSLQLDIFVNRLGEFSNPNSSGYARFLAPFDMIHLFSFDGVVSTIFGKGPGSYKVYESAMPYGKLAVSDPTWAKIILEYGVLGALFFSYYVKVCLRNTQSGLTAPVLFMFAITGGYLANGSTQLVVVCLLVWNRDDKVISPVLRKESMLNQLAKTNR